ncbi:MAG: tetratricopeptide repeat protein [Leptospirales bacterium]
MKRFPSLDRLSAAVPLILFTLSPVYAETPPSPTKPVIATPAGTPDPRALDCAGSLKSVDLALAQPMGNRTRLRLLILKARLLRDNKKVQNAKQEGMDTLDEGIRTAIREESLNPGQSWPWTMEGMLDLLKTQYMHFPKGMSYGKRASRANDQALEYAPDDPAANLSRGLEDYYKPWFVGGSYVKALKRFKKALSADPSNPRILSWTGLAYLALDREHLGYENLRKAARLCPQNPIYHKRLLTRRPR